MVLANIMKIVLVTIVFIVFDVLTGLLAARITHTYKSCIMREGGKHKLGLVCAILFGIVVDWGQTMVDLGLQIPLTAIICVYIIGMEIGSSMENVKKMNPSAFPTSVENIVDDTVDKLTERGED